jgi:hypothetical protein
MRTPEGRALYLLVERISGLCDGLEITDAWLWQVMNTFMGHPLVWPMDDHLYEMLLAWAGFDLTDADHVQLAAQLTAFMVATGHVDLRCSHGDAPSPLCVRARAYWPAVQHMGQRFAVSPECAALLAARAALEEVLTGAAQGGGEVDTAS